MSLRRTRANGGAAAAAASHPGVAGWAGGRQRLLLLVAAVATLLTLAPLAFADESDDSDTPPHDLTNVVMCVDPSSVAVHLQGMPAARQPTAASQVGPGETTALTAWLQRLGPAAVDRQSSCAGSHTYLAIDLRIVSLDGPAYRRYGPGAFSYAIWVQVGDYVAPADRSADNPSLANVRFEAYDEQVRNEGGPARLRAENVVLQQSESLMANLVAAYQADNP